MERIENKKARHDYSILETIEAGIVLSGSEVKSIRTHRATLDSAHVLILGNVAELLGMHIEPYQPKNMPESYDPKQSRKLLLSKKDMADLARKRTESGLTVIPLSVYNKGRYIKVLLGLARGKKKHDKRESLKKEATQRDLGRTLKNRR
jgi:SsrA-binding protein